MKSARELAEEIDTLCTEGGLNIEDRLALVTQLIEQFEKQTEQKIKDSNDGGDKLLAIDITISKLRATTDKILAGNLH